MRVSLAQSLPAPEERCAAELVAVAPRAVPQPIPIRSISSIRGSQEESRVSNGELQCTEEAQVQEHQSALGQNQSVSLSES